MVITRSDAADTVVAFYSAMFIAICGVVYQIGWAISSTTLEDFAVGAILFGAAGVAIIPPLIGLAERKGLIAKNIGPLLTPAESTHAQRVWGGVAIVGLVVAVAAVILYASTDTNFFFGLLFVGAGIFIAAVRALAYFRYMETRPT